MENKKDSSVKKDPENTPVAPTGSMSKEDCDTLVPEWISRIYKAVTISWTVENASLAMLWALMFLILSETVSLKVTVVAVTVP